MTQKLRALITDDLGYIRRLIRNILEANNYTDIREAEDGQEAVDIFLKQEAQKFDLITMDYQMPRLNGAEAVIRIREKNKKTPIICISASIPVFRPQVSHFKNIYFLEKPFRPEELKVILQEIQLV